MKRIVVTGATSMMGVALINSALEHKSEIYAIIRKGSNRKSRLIDSPLVHIVECDLSDLRGIKQLPMNCDVLYHFAWAGTNRIDRDNPSIQEKNIEYTLDAVELAQRCGCKKFVGAGSQAEYGPISGRIDDETMFNPITAYGVSKLAAGKLSQSLCERYGITFIWGRIFSVYGPNDNKGTMIDYAINQFEKKEKAEFSSAMQKWNYLYETDAGNIFYLLGDRIVTNSIYRIANRETKPLRSFIEEIAVQMNAESLCVFAPIDIKGSIYGIDTCDDKLFKDIDYEPQISFSEGIRRLLETRNNAI